MLVDLAKLMLVKLKHKHYFEILTSIGATMADKSGKANSGKARALALSPERRSEIARLAASGRWDKDLPRADFEGEFPISGTPIACAVLPN